MTKLVHKVNIIEPEIIQGEVLTEIDSLLQKLQGAEIGLELGRIKLGMLLNRVKEQDLWKEAGYKNFTAYLEFIEDRYHKGKTSIYAYFSTVRELRPYLSEQQMFQIGISKAKELMHSVKRSGSLAGTVIEAAVKPETTVDDVKRLLAEDGNPTTEEKGTWYPQEGFWVSDDEKKVLDAADQAAWHTDPVVQKDLPAWCRRKEARLRHAMEYLSTHSDMVERGEA